jgi:Ca2+-binding EF-hand superfamily protein
VNPRACRASILAASLLACAGAIAAEQSFDALDKDKDGLITASEARADSTVASRFAAADKNQDGYLSRAEFNDLRKP